MSKMRSIYIFTAKRPSQVDQYNWEMHIKLEEREVGERQKKTLEVTRSPMVREERKRKVWKREKVRDFFRTKVEAERLLKSRKGQQARSNN